MTTLSKEAAAYRANLAAMLEAAKEQKNVPPPSVDELRALLEGFAEMATPLPADTKVEEVSAGGVPALWVTPAEHGKRVLVYYHGGGYVCGSANSHLRIAGHLGARLNARTLVVDYRRAPENPFPSPIEDALTAYQFLLDNGHAASEIVFSGESAGGNLALATQLLARERGVPLPAATVVMSPWADLAFEGESVKTNAEKDLASNIEVSKGFAAMFIGDTGADPHNPLMSPVYGNYTGFGPLLVQVGDVELVLSDAERIVAAAGKAGVVAELDVCPEMQHMFQMWAGNMPEADAALDRLAAFVNKNAPEA
ncbi:alpha/beta hydrolase [Streptomyces hirsutus]|uniref:alpha/beta hydrolase n=1 Tax=Streptomyces hirsutus TaxID=35620 RepID=UPI00341B5168